MMLMMLIMTMKIMMLIIKSDTSHSLGGLYGFLFVPLAVGEIIPPPPHVLILTCVIIILTEIIPPQLVFAVCRLGQISPVRYAKFQSIRYFIDIDIFQNSLIDIDIDINIFKNGHIDIDIDIDIFQIVLIDIDIDIDIFQISLSIFLSISIFSKFSYRYFFDIDILKISIDISSIFQKKPIYRQSISIFHQKNMKNSHFC